MFESEHQYFCLGKYLGVGGGGALVGNGAIVPRASETARVEMLALF